MEPRKHQQPSGSSRPGRLRITVVIATYRRPGPLRAALESLFRQQRLADETIIIDDSEDAQSQRVVDEFRHDSRAGFVYERRTGERGLTSARNRAIDLASGDVVVFLDDDVVLDSGYLDAIERFYVERPTARGVQGHWGPPSTAASGFARWLSRGFCLFHYEDPGGRVLSSGNATYPLRPRQPLEVEWLSGCNQSYRRGVFDEFRFDEKLTRYGFGEDLDFSYRLWRRHPHSLFLTPSARLAHERSDKPRSATRTDAYLATAYRLYLFHKLGPATPIRRISFLWSKLGELLLTIAKVLLPPSDRRRTSPRGFWYWLTAHAYVRGLGKRIQVGDLACLDPILSQEDDRSGPSS